MENHRASCRFVTLIMLSPNSTIIAPSELNNFCTHQTQQLLHPPNSTIIAPRHRNYQLCLGILVASRFVDPAPGGTKTKAACMKVLAPAAVARNRLLRKLSKLVSGGRHVKAFAWHRKSLENSRVCYWVPRFVRLELPTAKVWTA